ncbi:protein FAR-RED ELONGATED HYPOCOTYL 3-like [Beta vulgaris subsp. vulgaris]|uniref:protein FAR-RED ELONGATED HYPOCOTYL 3-like n=1 Tax=Beta vulgaris subsp. vulgaris TaxID=3555 RepID=UPI0025485E88|nr:protein FAR-RED ELONGATED HYPOCOTYL 3-like [Beta vulgaris subsp. vulgaris]
MKVLYLEWTGKQDVGQELVEHTYEDRVWVVSKDTKKEVPLDRNCEYVVLIDMETTEAKCECKLFESAGILCRHIISLYNKLKIKEIPEKYILRRWRKDVFRKHTMVKVAYHDPSKTDEVQNYDRMMVVFDPFCLKAANYGDVHTVLETLQVLNIRLDERHSMKIAGMSLKDCTPTSVGNTHWVQLANGSVGVGSCNRVEKSPNECEGSRIEVNVGPIKDPPTKKIKRAGRIKSCVEKAKNEKAKNEKGKNDKGKNAEAKKKQQEAPKKGKGKGVKRKENADPPPQV